jgi:hypothetical protein
MFILGIKRNVVAFEKDRAIYACVGGARLFQDLKSSQPDTAGHIPAQVLIRDAAGGTHAY